MRDVETGRNKREDVRRETVRRSKLRTRKQERAYTGEKNNWGSDSAGGGAGRRRALDNTICTVPAFATSYNRFIKIIQRLPPAVMPVATLTGADIIVTRYLNEGPLLPFPLPHSWDFRPAYGQKKPSGLNFHPSSRSTSRWSRHIGQCYSSVSFLYFFLCTLLPLSSSLFFLYLLPF